MGRTTNLSSAIILSDEKVLVNRAKGDNFYLTGVSLYYIVVLIKYIYEIYKIFRK